MTKNLSFEKGDTATCVRNDTVTDELTIGESYTVLDYTSMFHGWVSVTNNWGEIQNYPVGLFKKD